MAALGQRGHFKLILSSCPRILSGRTRNRPLSPNGNSYPRSCRILYPNRTLSSLAANRFVLQHLGPSSHRGAPSSSTCFIPSRNKSSFTSVFLPIVGKNNNKSFRSPLDQILNISSLLPSSHPTLLPSDIQCRFRQKRKNRNKSQEEESFSDDEDELEVEEYEEETDLPQNYKQLKIHVKSPRADALLSTGLNISRAKIDSMFYASKLLLNDKPLTKKSKNLNEGDCIDLITDTSEEIMVKRVKVLNVSSDKGRTDKVTVVLRAWRSPFSLSSLEEEK